MWTRRLRMPLAAVLAALAVVSGAVPVAAVPAGPQWRPCAENAALDCTTVPVAVDWGRPDGPKIDLAVARRKAADPAARVGALVYAPAGPGSSGVDTLASDPLFAMMFPARVAARFDVVSFDPRGVHRSSPVRCDPAVVGKLAGGELRDQADFEQRLAVQAEIGASCRERTGPVIDHLDSVQQAHDLDAIRAALGERTLNVYALSYGTVLAQMYAERFPRRLRTMVLDAVVDHSAGTEETELLSALGAQESFEAFTAWCAASPACVLHGRDVRRIVAGLYAKADAGELRGPSGPLDRRQLSAYLLSPLGNANVTEMANRIDQLTKPAGNPVAPTSSGVDPGALPIYIYCADHRNSIDSYAKYRALRVRSERVAPDVKAGWHGVPWLCVNPPFRVTNPPHRLRVHGAPTLLVTNSRYDDSTPHQGAAEVARQIGDAALLTYDGIGHGAAVRGACMREAVTAYLIDRWTPGPGAHCPAEPLP